MKRRKSKTRTSRFELLNQRNTLALKLERRSEAEKALLDGDPLMLLMLILVAAIWGFELTANWLNPTGWSGTAHLVAVGFLEVLVLYCLFSAARAAWIRRRIRDLDMKLRRSTLPAFST